MSDTKAFWQSKGTPDFGNYTAVPTFFTQELMMIGHGIPPHFWKFTSIAWRSFMEQEKQPHTGKFVCTHRFAFTEEQLETEYGIYGKAAAWCAAAYRASGLCGVEKGRRHRFDQPGTPTTIHYHRDSTKDDWRAFIAALKVQCREDRANRWGGSDDAFSVSLAWKVKEQRQVLNLGNDKINTWLVKMKDTIQRHDNGVQFVTRVAVKRFGSKQTDEYGT
jgi:hypothetical protein